MAEHTLISAAQLRRLHTLWGLLCRHARIDPRDRAARIGWLTGAVGRPVPSSKELTRAEADRAITAIQQRLPPELLKHNRPSRERARAYGTAGRGKRNAESGIRDPLIDLVDAPTLALLARLRDALGMTQQRFELFHQQRLHITQVRTQADANKIKWALQNMIKTAKKKEARQEESCLV